MATDTTTNTETTEHQESDVASRPAWLLAESFVVYFGFVGALIFSCAIVVALLSSAFF